MSCTSSSGNTLTFSNILFKFILNRYANKFSSFSSGKIAVEDHGDHFKIYMQGNLNRLFIKAAIIAATLTAVLVFPMGFDIFTLITGVIIFLLLCVIGYIITSISFPVYFVSLRNNIQQELEKETTRFDSSFQFPEEK